MVVISFSRFQFQHTLHIVTPERMVGAVIYVLYCQVIVSPSENTHGDLGRADEGVKVYLINYSAYFMRVSNLNMQT